MAKKSYKNIIIIIGIILLLYILFRGNIMEKFASTTPASFIQLKARDLQDQHLSSTRLTPCCGIRPTLRGSPVAGYLRF